MARPQKPRCICSIPEALTFLPAGKDSGNPVVLRLDEYECLRLIDYEALSQEECAKRMQVSRTTVTRIYSQARRKLITALTESRRLELRGGDVFVCHAPRPECADNPHCCHRTKKKIVEREESKE